VRGLHRAGHEVAAIFGSIGSLLSLLPTSSAGRAQSKETSNNHGRGGPPLYPRRRSASYGRRLGRWISFPRLDLYDSCELPCIHDRFRRPSPTHPAHSVPGGRGDRFFSWGIPPRRSGWRLNLPVVGRVVICRPLPVSRVLRQASAAESPRRPFPVAFSIFTPGNSTPNQPRLPLRGIAASEPTAGSPQPSLCVLSWGGHPFFALRFYVAHDLDPFAGRSPNFRLAASAADLRAMNGRFNPPTARSADDPPVPRSALSRRRRRRISGAVLLTVWPWIASGRRSPIPLYYAVSPCRASVPVDRDGLRMRVRGMGCGSLTSLTL